MIVTNPIVLNALIDYGASEQEYIDSVRKMIPGFKKLAKKSVALKEEVKKRREELKILETQAMKAFNDALNYRNNSGFKDMTANRFKSSEWKRLVEEVEAIEF